MAKEKNVDFSSKELPENRFKQFFDIFKHRFLDILKISLLEAMFLMPLLASLILFYAFVKSAQGADSLFTVFLFQSISLLITVPIGYIGLVGVFTCLKKIVQADSEYTASSFFIGLKNDWYHGLIIGIFEGLSTGILVMGIFFFLVYPNNQLPAEVNGLGIVVSIVQFIVITMCSYHSLMQFVCYTNKVGATIKNSFLLVLSRFPLNLIFIIIHPGIFVALVSVMEITMFVGVVIMLIFSGVFHLIWALNTISAFDKFINRHYHPEVYRKGLLPKEEEIIPIVNDEDEEEQEVQ